MGDSIGHRIKSKRLELKLTQNQVAEKLFVTQQTVARWENGKHTLPVKAVQDLSELFDVPTAYFFGEDQVIMRRFNFFAFVGSVLVNFILFWLIAATLLTVLLALWAMLGAGLVAPIVVIWQFIIGVHIFSVGRLIISCCMLLVSLATMPIAWKIACYMGRILRAYYRYNVNSIVYEVVPKEVRHDHCEED
ncbi:MULTISPECIES: helix-turn-helix transcriptional regulator [Lactiplantibacillus]|uniref:Helix-turn-helix transcriptional regulator n=1 Tax=Lactiplantibacillus pentosus TaxID=1589 RepID=A0AAW8WBE6_LACPE|nr:MULTISPECIES: helix-turn-helix transcriptional regulator [Lactiplantibacillus]AUI77576.1 XRE family transcriptional regulator [Lactiplantibacillus pentosus]MBU7461884.1 helix-turn-helix transcriptional regulator [Lactiplantibacillus pentosus]MBU7478111.1 helix-turn-helix transcriptional regulator [Lactiplantibacillus pentosus]MBU7484487.1 helix-turn-helix transcriptional regulator [Lactiplantibacillus sp. 30.2.29]MBU7487744.1 helix-turn-helix transcriptional regulator [Lactiplantibacillus p